MEFLEKLAILKHALDLRRKKKLPSFDLGGLSGGVDSSAAPAVSSAPMNISQRTREALGVPGGAGSSPVGGGGSMPAAPSMPAAGGGGAKPVAADSPAYGAVPEFKGDLYRPSGRDDIIKVFGNPGQVKLAPVDIPASLQKALGKRQSLHHLVAPKFRAALDDIDKQGLSGLIKSWDGAYDPRNKRGYKGGKGPLVAGQESGHAWGAAFDINAATNGMGNRPTLDPRIVKAFENQGFNWGGRWGSPDGMHFQYFSGF